MKSLNKARDILCLVAQEPGIGLSRLARTLELPKSTVYRIVRALESAGLLTQSGDGQYSLGGLVYELASGSTRTGLIEIARPAMVRLRDACNETVALHVLQGSGWAPLAQVESLQELRRTIRNLGAATPLHAGAAGKLFLAFMTESERRRYLENEDLRPLTPHTPTNRRRLLQELTLIRRRGYSTSEQEVAIGVAGVVMPIPRPDGSVREALGVSGPMARFNAKAIGKIVEGLEEAVEEITHRLTRMSTARGVIGMQKYAKPTIEAADEPVQRKRKEKA